MNLISAFYQTNKKKPFRRIFAPCPDHLRQPDPHQDRSTSPQELPKVCAGQGGGGGVPRYANKKSSKKCPIHLFFLNAGATGLHLAIAYNNDEVAEMLIACGASPIERARGVFFMPTDQQSDRPVVNTNYAVGRYFCL